MSNYFFKQNTMKFKNRKFSILFLAIITLLSCDKKDDDLITQSKAIFNIKLKSNVAAVEWGITNNTNLAGNSYSINTLNLFISNVTLKGEKGNYYSKQIFYVDPKTESFSSITLDSIPTGTYSEMTFDIGLDASHNVSYALSGTTENMNMAWPDMMGGGYHFLKMEGHYLDLTGTPKGYAIHLGNNMNLASVSLTYPLVQIGKEHNYTLFYNINEVFANPYTYDLNIEKSYTMSSPAAMLLIKNNISDVFSVQQNN